MKTKTIYSILVSLLITSSAVAGSHVAAPGAKFNVICPAKELLPRLDFAYHRCNNGDKASCKTFVNLFSEAIPTYDCHRDFDQDYVVPALWLADAADWDYVRLLSQLKSPEARKLFASERFSFGSRWCFGREILDRSRAAERALKRTK